MSDKFKDLAAPFPPTDIEWRAGATNRDKTKALALAYITARAVMDRLDTVVGPENWCDEYKPGPAGGILCGISIRVDGEWLTKWDGAENRDDSSAPESFAVKSGLSDALKRAAVKWGIGRYLYNLDGVWVKCEQRGKSVVLSETPGLPKWALPEGMREVKPTQTPKTEKPHPSANGKVNTKTPHAKRPAVLQWIEEEGYAKNSHNAAALYDLLNNEGQIDQMLDADLGAVVRTVIKKYRGARDEGMTKEFALVHAFEGKPE